MIKQFKMTEAEARRVRNSSKRRGFIAVLHFGPRYRVRRSDLFVTATDADRWADDQIERPRYVQAVTDVTIHEVDSFGRSLSTI